MKKLRLRKCRQGKYQKIVGIVLIVAMLFSSDLASATDTAEDALTYTLENFLKLSAYQEESMASDLPIQANSKTDESSPEDMSDTGKGFQDEERCGGLCLMIEDKGGSTTPLQVGEMPIEDVKNLKERVMTHFPDVRFSEDSIAYCVQKKTIAPKNIETDTCRYYAHFRWADLPIPIKSNERWRCYLLDDQGSVKDLSKAFREQLAESDDKGSDLTFLAKPFTVIMLVKETEQKAIEEEKEKKEESTETNQQAEEPQDTKQKNAQDFEGKQSELEKEEEIKSQALMPFITKIISSRFIEGNWVPTKEFEVGEKIKLEILYQLPDLETGKKLTLFYQLPKGIRAIAPENFESIKSLEDSRENETSTVKQNYKLRENNTIEFSPSESIVQKKEGTLTIWAELDKEILTDTINFPGTDLTLRILSMPTSFMQLFRSGIGGPVMVPETISNEDIAPDNYLQIIDHTPGAYAEIIDRGKAVAGDARIDANAPVDNGIWGGEWPKASQNIYDKFKGGGGATAVKFTPSNPHQQAWEWPQNRHSTEMDFGWKKRDLELSSTDMRVTVFYHNAAYYKGDLVDAEAEIKVTPMKNRTPGANWGNSNYTQNPYTPIIQFSDNLYRGWCWQNVREININLKFFRKNGEQITFKSGQFGDEKATYYTINSLNEAAIQGDGEEPPAAYGPEYVVPEDGSYTAAYVIPESNIKTEYDGGHQTGWQYAYNGGRNHWNDDDPTLQGWSKNSVLFTTGNTDHLNFTMGNLSRDPQRQKVRRTNFVWTSMSTQSFTNHYVEYRDIPVQKNWSNKEDEVHAPISVDLYLHFRYQGQEHIELLGTIELSKENNWQGKFMRLPKEDAMHRLLAKRYKTSVHQISEVSYQVKEQPVEGYKSTVIKHGDGWLIHNERTVSGYTLPTTGGPGYLPFCRIGFIILLVGFGLFRRQRNDQFVNHRSGFSGLSAESATASGLCPIRRAAPCRFFKMLLVTVSSNCWSWWGSGNCSKLSTILSGARSSKGKSVMKSSYDEAFMASISTR